MPAVGGHMGVPGGGQPSCFQKIRMGFMMGCMIGGATGVLIGGFSALRMGLRGKDLLIQVGFPDFFVEKLFRPERSSRSRVVLSESSCQLPKDFAANRYVWPHRLPVQSSKCISR